MDCLGLARYFGFLKKAQVLYLLQDRRKLEEQQQTVRTTNTEELVSSDFNISYLWVEVRLDRISLRVPVNQILIQIVARQRTYMLTPLIVNTVSEALDQLEHLLVFLLNTFHLRRVQHIVVDQAAHALHGLADPVAQFLAPLESA